MQNDFCVIFVWLHKKTKNKRKMLFFNKKTEHKAQFFVWLGWQDLNLRMHESKSCALPLGDTPSLKFSQQTYKKSHKTTGWGGRIRTCGCWNQNPMPYHLATPHRFCGVAILYGVIEEDRTLDLQSHNLAFYQLNYDHQIIGAPSRIRTCDLCLRRALLYPAELWKRLEQVKGIGPSRPAWKAGVLPLNYTCIFSDCVMITQHKTFVNNFK